MVANVNKEDGSGPGGIGSTRLVLPSSYRIIGPSVIEKNNNQLSVFGEGNRILRLFNNLTANTLLNNHHNGECCQSEGDGGRDIFLTYF